METHDQFFSPTPDPQNAGKFMHLSQAMDDPLIKFIPDMHLPKKQMKLEHGDGYRCTICPKSLVGSSFRSYAFHSKRNWDRHNIIFHHSVLKNKNRTQARAGVPSTQRARKSKFVCPDKECMLAFSSGQALRKPHFHSQTSHLWPPTQKTWKENIRCYRTPEYSSWQQGFETIFKKFTLFRNTRPCAYTSPQAWHTNSVSWSRMCAFFNYNPRSYFTSTVFPQL